MKFNESKYRDIIGKYFNYSGDFEFLDVVADAVESAIDCETEDDMYEAISENAYMWYADSWKIFEHYCWTDIYTGCSFDDAYSEFEDDVMGIIRKIKEDSNADK